MPVFLSAQQSFSQLRAAGCSPGALSGVRITILMVLDESDIIKVHPEARTFGKHCCIHLQGGSRYITTVFVCSSS